MMIQKKLKGLERMEVLITSNVNVIAVYIILEMQR